MSTGPQALSFRCPHCQYPFRYRPELAGRKGSCPKCKQAIEVPRLPSPAAAISTVPPPKPVRSPGTPAKAAAPVPKPDPRTEILNAFKSQIEPVETTGLYQLGILLAAASMFLLALAYLGIIAGVAYLIYYHAVYDVTVFSNTGSERNSTKAALFAYLAPLLAGGILLLFLIKPLFAQKGRYRQATFVAKAG